VDRIALVARLKPGTEERAEQLLAGGPPFDPRESGFNRHEVYVSASEVIFVFEAQEVEWILDEMMSELGGSLPPALAAWRDLVDGPPRIARPAFVWPEDEAAG